MLQRGIMDTFQQLNIVICFQKVYSSLTNKTKRLIKVSILLEFCIVNIGLFGV